MSRSRACSRVAPAAPASSVVVPWGRVATDGERRRVRTLVLVSRSPDEIRVVPGDDVRDTVGERKGVPALEVAVQDVVSPKVGVCVDDLSAVDNVAALKVAVFVYDVALREPGLSLGLPLGATTAPDYCFVRPDCRVSQVTFYNQVIDN